MPGHYKKNKGTVRIPVIPYDSNTEANSPPPLPPLPPKYDILKDKASSGNSSSSSTSAKKSKNPFEGQTVIRNGKKVKRTPSTRPHKD